MKFSIIIPVYNVEPYLRDCLNSIVAQSYHDYEVICVNDGSTDGSLAILLEYESKYANIVVIDSLNGGTASARNKGLEVAQGDYIWFVDSDDWIEKDALQLLNDKLTDKTLDVLCFNGKLKYEEDGRIEQDSGFEENLLSGWEYYNKYALIKRKFHFVCVVLRLYRREFLIQNGLYFKNGVSFEDNLWIPVVFYYAQTIRSISAVLYTYRIRQGSKMHTVNEKALIGLIDVANELSRFFIPLKEIDKSVIYREIAGKYFLCIILSTENRYGLKYIQLKSLINWENLHTVCKYPRHKRMFLFLRLNIYLFKVYILVEGVIKFFANNCHENYK